MKTVRVFYSPDYVGSSYAFDTTRKAKWIADSLAARPIPGIELTAPRPLLEAEVAEVHDPEYVEAVRDGNAPPPRRIAGFQLGSRPVADGAGLQRGSGRGGRRKRCGRVAPGRCRAVCIMRGARRRRISARSTGSSSPRNGFCGAESVLILDLDAHCGGGTSRLIMEEPRIRQVDVAVDGFDIYRPSSRCTLERVEDPQRYLPTIRQRLVELDHDRAAFDLCLYNAGMDPFEGCSTGGLRGINREILAERNGWCSTGARNAGSPLLSCWRADMWDDHWKQTNWSSCID